MNNIVIEQTKLEKLLVRPFPIMDEGAKGYLLRLANCNGIDAIGRRVVAGGRPTDEELISLLGRDDRPFWRDHPEKGFWLDSVRKDNVHWNWVKRRCCPACLAENPYWRAEWELRNMATCSAHKTKLIDTCPQCHSEIGWKTQEITQCSCGYDLRKAPVENSDENEVALATAYRAIMGWTEMPEKLIFLKSLSVNDLFLLIRYLGSLETEDKRQLRIEERRMEDIAPIFNRASKILAGWPESYHQCLNQICKGIKPDSTTIRLQTVFGGAYTGLYMSLKAESLNLVRREFEQFLRTNWQWSLSNRNRRLTEETRSGGMWMPAAQAAKFLQVRSAHISLLVDKGEMEGRVISTEKERIQLVVFIKDVEKTKQLMDDVITLSDATELVGISDKRAFELIDAKVVQPLSRPSKNGYGQWKFSRTALKKLLEPGQDKQVLELSDLSEQLTLKGLMQSSLRGLHSFPSLMKPIIEGSILVTACIKDQQGISGWVISKADYETWLQDQIDEGEHRLSIQKTAALLRTKEEVAYKLVKHGLIKTKLVERNGRSLQMVSFDEIVKFKDRYVFNAQLAEQLKISPRMLLKKFAAMGAQPYLKIGRGTIRQAFFERTKSFEYCLEQMY